MERIVTDARGDRWDVSQENENDGRYRIRFRHQTGEDYETASRLGVSELSDRQLLEMLEEETGAGEVMRGRERSADPDGYITH